MEQTDFIKQKNDDGSDNPKYVDLLEEDKPISGQKFACVYHSSHLKKFCGIRNSFILKNF